MKKKLALQQLIDYVNNRPSTQIDDKQFTQMIPYGEIVYLAKELLSVEKEEIIEAYHSGTSQFANDARIDYPQTPQDYIEKTFEQ